MSHAQFDQLAIYLDPKDPECYLALPGTRALLQDTAVTACWYPLQVDLPNAPKPEPKSSEARGLRHRWFRENYRARELAYYAKVLGLPLQAIYRSARSQCAAIALLWLQQQQQPVDVLNWLQALCQRHFEQAAALTDHQDTIITLLAEQGLDTADFEHYLAQQGQQQLQIQLEKNLQQGVIRGPAYRWQDQLYIGREHLPLLHQLITAT